MQKWCRRGLLLTRRKGGQQPLLYWQDETKGSERGQRGSMTPQDHVYIYVLENVFA